MSNCFNHLWLAQDAFKEGAFLWHKKDSFHSKSSFPCRFMAYLISHSECRFTTDQYIVTDCKLVRKWSWVYKHGWSSNLNWEDVDRRQGNMICPQASAVNGCKRSNQFSPAAGRLGDAGQTGQAEATCSHGTAWLCCHLLFPPSMVCSSTKDSTCTQKTASSISLPL